MEAKKKRKIDSFLFYLPKEMLKNSDPYDEEFNDRDLALLELGDLSRDAVLNFEELKQDFPD